MSQLSRPVILLIDTDNAVLRQLATLLQGDFVVRAANSAERALRSATITPPPDIVLLGSPDVAGLHDELRARLPQAHVEVLELPVHGFSLLARLRRQCGIPDPVAKSPLSGRRALIVEDEEMLRQVLGEQLQSAGIGYATAVDGSAVLPQVRHERFDWVLMDVQMPVMDGLETVRRLRADPLTAKLCVIATTGSGDEASRAECLSAGMSDFLVKPIIRDQLVAVLNTWLDQPHGAVPSVASPATPASPASAAPDFDAAKLAELGRNNPQRMRQFADQFVAGMTAGLSASTTALAAGDLDSVAGHAHRLKSSARWVGALALGNLLAGLEAAAKAGQVEAADASLAACRTASADFLQQLQQHLDNINRGTS